LVVVCRAETHLKVGSTEDYKYVNSEKRKKNPSSLPEGEPVRQKDCEKREKPPVGPRRKKRHPCTLGRFGRRKKDNQISLEPYQKPN